MGIAYLSITVDKAETFANDLVKHDELKTEDAKDFIDHIVEGGEEESQILNKSTCEETERVMKELDIVTKCDIDSLIKNRYS